MLELHVIQGPDRGRKFVLPPNEPQLIGRSSESLPLSDTTVSRRHAELTPDNGTWWLRDLDSANGTFVNGHPLDDRVQLSPGDQIRCGGTLFLFAQAPDETRSSTIDMLDEDAFDLTVERTSTTANDESMMLAAPDPLRAAMDHLRVIYELTALTASTLEEGELLERVMDLIFHEFRPDRGFILKQASAEDRPLPMVVRYREKPRTPDEGRIPVSRTIIQHTLREGEGILSTNAMNDTRFRSGDSVRDYGIRSAICSPIQAGRRVFGVIHIDSSLANFTFTESQLQLLNAIGQHTGLALLNRELVTSKMQTERLAAMGQTVASLSHSVKNILQGLRGGADAVELALNRGDLELAKQGWPILARNLDRIYALTLNMLAYSRTPSLDIELTSLNALIREATDLLQVPVDRKRVGLMLDLAEDMPPIPVDPSAMHQAVMNLVTNAIEAAPAKKGVVTVTTGFDASRQEAVIRVSDNGPGIHAERQAEIFEPFSSTKGQRGTGLGLAVTRKIVQEHGGRIDVASEVGAGSTFTITLPSDSSSMSAADTRLPRPRPATNLDEDF